MEVGDAFYAVNAVAFARDQLGFTPDRKQQSVLMASAKRGILNCTRQWGKSTVTAIKVLHRAVTVPKSLVLVASPGGRQSGEYLRKVTELDRRLGIRPRGDGDNEISLLLPNGSRIVGLPGSEPTTRGFSAVSLLVIDEAARVRDEMYHSVRPMLAVSNGDLWLMSTPNGKRGFFWEEWSRPGISVPATECARIRGEFLAEERMSKGERLFRQEYMCEFTSSNDAVFNEDSIQRALTWDIEPLKIAPFMPRSRKQKAEDRHGGDTD
jgi:hypothetical protein